jgi:protocatechuate 3,4-dioxygenase beta subunit
VGALLVLASAAAWWWLRAPDLAPPIDARVAERTDGGPVLTPRPPLPAPGRATAPGVDHRLLIRVTRDDAPARANVEIWSDASVAGASAPGAPLSLHTIEGPALEVDGPPSGWLVVIARGAENTQARARLHLPEIRGVTEVVLDLLPADGRIGGTVRHADGRPWTGKVHVRLSGESRERHVRLPGDPAAQTGPDGAFTLSGVLPGKHRFWLQDDTGAVRTGPDAWVPASAPVSLTWRAGKELRGIVVASPGGEPIAGAHLRFEADFSEDEAGAFVEQTRTGPDGRFALEAVPRFGHLDVVAAGRTPVRIGASPDREMRIGLLGRGRLVGRVTARDGGAPVAGVRVEVTPDWMWADEPPERVATTTDAAGAYELDDIPVGKVRVAVRGGGWIAEVRTGDRSIGPLLPDVENVVDLEAEPARSVLGRVLGPGGEAVAGANIRVGPNGVHGTAVSAEDGSFRLDGLAADRDYGVWATKPGYGPAKDEFEAGHGVVELTVRLTIPRFLDLRLVGPDGSPPAHASAAIRVEQKNVFWFGMPDVGPVPADREGRCRIGPVPAATLTLTVEAAGCVSVEQEVPGSGTPTGFESPWTLRLERAYEIRGRVLWDDGVPAAGAEVTMSEPRYERVETDAAGAFVIAGLPAGRHTLSVGGRYGSVLIDEGRSVRVDAGTSDLVVTLPREEPEGLRPQDDPRKEIRVRVVDAEGRQVPEADLELRDEDGRHVESFTVRDGNAEVRLYVRRHVLHVGRATDHQGQSVGAGPVRMPLSEPFPDELEVRLPPERLIEGRVLDPAGRPARGLSLTAIDSETKGVCAQARTDGAGAFRLRGLGDAIYRLSVEAPADARAPKDLQAAGGTAGLVVRLLPAVAAWITVLDPDGAPVSGAIVRTSRVEDAASVDSIGSSSDNDVYCDPRGRARLAHLEPGVPLMLTVAVSGGSLRYGPVPWTPADTTVRLARPLTVRGRVLDPQGRPVPEAAVLYASDSWKQARARTDAEGAFEITDLSPGEIEIQAGLQTEREREHWRWASPFGEGGVCRNLLGPSRKVAVGSSGIVLELDPGPTLSVRLAGATAADKGRPVRLTKEGEDPNAWRPECVTAPLDEHGIARFRAVDPAASYTVFIGLLPENRCVFRRGVVLGPTEVVVESTPGLPTRGKVLPPPSRAGGVVVRMVSGGVALELQVDAEGAFDLGGLPPGRWSLRASSQGGVSEGYESGRRVEGEVVAGETVTLTFSSGR